MSKMSVTEFGDQLIQTRDLDPVYVMLYHGRRSGAIRSDQQLARWLFSYWCFYHAGLASWLSERDDPEDYWNRFRQAAENVTSPRHLQLPADRWPRSPERRHFRGQKCVVAVDAYERYGSPSLIIAGLLHTEDPLRYRLRAATVLKRASLLPQFGPWIGFKVADMIERVLGYPVEFPDDIGLIYEEPRKALDILVQEKGEVYREAHTGITEEDGLGEEGRIWHYLRRRWANTPAPPDLARPCGPQEVETVLCKWKSYLGGHYDIGKDTRELSHGLPGWGVTAEGLKRDLLENTRPPLTA